MDPIISSLRELTSEDISPNICKDDKEKRKLIETVGPRSCRNILKARRDYPLSRIPFLFSSIDPQLVVDVLSNELEEILESILGPVKSKKR